MKEKNITPETEEVVKPVKETPTEPAKPVVKFGKVIDADLLNVRKEPDGDILATIPGGTELTIDAEFKNKNWLKVKAPTAGYVMKKFVKVD